jgi:hypothetical protein
VAALVRAAPGVQDLLDGAQQTVAVGEHDVVELCAARRVHLARLEGFEVEADGGDGRLQLVRDGVDEGVVLLVAAYLADEEGGVEDEAGDDDGEEDDAEDEQRDLSPVEQNPADVEREREDDEADAERQKEDNGFAAAADAHACILK